MILEIPANARDVGDDSNAVRAQLVCRTDTGGHQNSWGLDRAGAEHDLPMGAHRTKLSVAHILYARHSTAFDDQTSHVRRRSDREVRPRPDRCEERIRRAVATTVQDVLLIEAGHGFRFGRVEVVPVIGAESL